MGSKHSLMEYAFAKDVVKDFPKMKKVFDESYKILYAYRQFLAAQHVLDAISDSQEMVKRQYEHYKTVLDKKGKE